MAEADVHWRNTAKVLRISLKIISVDARAFTLFPALVLIKSWKIAAVGLIIMFFFIIIERKGFTFPNFLRAVRVWIVGKVKRVRPIE